MGNKAIFDAMASQYETLERIEIANKIVEEIQQYIVGGKQKKAIDFGCGTGLVGFALQQAFASLTFLDISPNMIAYVQKKIEAMGITHASAICMDTEQNEITVAPADCIMVVQALLHVEDTAAMLQKLYRLLNPGGQLIVVDFDRNNLVQSELVHNGFDQKELADALKKTGFAQVESHTFYHGKAMFMHQDASLFSMNAQKLGFVEC